MVEPTIKVIPIFHKVSENRRFQDVVQQIEEAIIDGRLSCGDVLPPERDLKEIFNISRNTLREALRVLEDRGLIEIKVGFRGGAVVSKLSTQKASETLAFLIRSEVVSFDHLAEFRQDIEGGVASLAAQRATDEDIKSLKNLAREAYQCISVHGQNQNKFLTIDEKFHITLAKISRNPVYFLIIKSIHANIHNYYKKYLLDKYLLMDENELDENYQYFCDIIDALEKKQINEAKILSENHVLRHSRKRRNVNIKK
jgi:DNA-binding FadR family transcriptional regulator